MKTQENAEKNLSLLFRPTFVIGLLEIHPFRPCKLNRYLQERTKYTLSRAAARFTANHEIHFLSRRAISARRKSESGLLRSPAAAVDANWRLSR